MQTQHLIAGTPEWHAHRAQHFNASDAPAMLGCSPYKTRSELLRELATGIGAEHDAATERRFADGHRFEALARPLAEEIIGDDLAPVVGVLEGTKLSASFDGLTLMGDTAFEHKTLNDDLRGCLRDEGNGHDLPKHYRAQMEQQLLVSGAERVLFMASKWDGDTLVEERHCWYASDPALRAEIVAGWGQFAADLSAYSPPETAAPKLVAEAVEALPAVTVQVSGELVLRDNFKTFEQALRDFLEHRLIREPKTDQDFADLDVQIKAMKGAEAALESAEAQMLAQIQSVDQAKRTKDMLHKLVRDNRLMAEKLLASEKERRRGEIVAGGLAALKAHVDALNERLGKPYMPAIPADFGGAVKGLKSLASMEDKAATELARAKIAANEAADRIDRNLKHLREHAGEYRALFPDTATIVLKAPEDLRALVSARIAEHKAAEEKRLEQERERIRAEEAARLEREQAAREAEARRQREAEARAAADAELRAAQTKVEGAALSPAAQALNEKEGAARFATAHPSVAPAANVVPIQRPAPATPQPATLNLGAINTRLGFTMNADFVRRLGIEPAAVDKNARLYSEHQFDLICEALVAHVRTVQHQQQKVA